MRGGAKIKACTAALAVVLSMPAEATIYTTTEMMGSCRPLNLADNKMKAAICYGALDVLGDLGLMLKPQFQFCMPKGTKLDEAARVFEAYAYQHPEDRNQDFKLTAWTALKLAFPCKTAE